MAKVNDDNEGLQEEEDEEEGALDNGEGCYHLICGGVNMCASVCVCGVYLCQNALFLCVRL